jgi:hypothetical protein
MNPMYSGHYTLSDQPIAAPAEAEAKSGDHKGGFPHSEIAGSKGARASPALIAACHVLHRLSMPRHPSEALMRLIVLSKTHAVSGLAASRGEA